MPLIYLEISFLTANLHREDRTSLRSTQYFNIDIFMLI